VPPSSILDDPRVAGPSTHLPDGGEDHLVTKMAVQVVRTMHPRMLLMNYPEFDWPVGHIDGGMEDPAAVTTLMTGFDEDLGQLEETYRKAGILDQTLFVITADHGMMPITHFIPAGVIENAISQAGTTAPDIAANSADYIWLADPTRAQTVAQNVMAAKEPGIQMAYYLTTVNGAPGYVPATPGVLTTREERANQYLLGALLNGHEPAVVVFGQEGASFSDPASKWKADHGGNSWKSQHVPLVLAGPGIVRGKVTGQPAQLEDIAPTVLSDMGVRPAGMEGHVLSVALDHAPTGRVQARKTEVRRIAQVVRSLAAQSRAGGSD
jgi:arylsulfatase A-like enzyme